MGQNQLDVIKRETMLQTTNAWVKRLSAFANSNELNFSKYQETIVVNTVRKIQESGFDIYAHDQNNVADILYQTAFLNLNPSAIPRHCYFIERTIYTDGKPQGKKLEMGIEGEGNDEILRKFGYEVKHIHKVWVIRDGDEYQEGYYQGINYVPPTWKPRLLKMGERKGAVLKVVYPIERKDGSVEYWGADREDLQPILLKHIEQNLSTYRKADKVAYNKLMKRLQTLSFDEILNEYNETEISFTYYNKSNTSKLISESYVGPTGDPMIIRKLRNVAVRTFPKNFDTTLVEKIYETTFEEKYNKPLIENVTKENLEDEVQEKANTVVVEDKDTIGNIKEILETKQETKQVKQTKKELVRENVIDAVVEENIQKNIQENIQETSSAIDDDLEDCFDWV